jgi:hypothetical protein
MELRNRKLKEKKGKGTVTTLSRSHNGAKTLGITPLGIMAFSIKCLHLTLSINDTWYNNALPSC